MSSVQSYALTPEKLFAAAYGTGTYSCGQYEVGCNTSSTTTGLLPPDASAILSEPSIVIPGSLFLAIVIALISTSIVKLLRRRKNNKTN